MSNVFGICMAPSYSYCLLVIFAQEQGPIFVPFGWNRVPATARVIASAAGTTTYGLIDGGFSPGPGTSPYFVYLLELSLTEINLTF